jgi:hypothetical protein
VTEAETTFSIDKAALFINKDMENALKLVADVGSNVARLHPARGGESCDIFAVEVV